MSFSGGSVSSNLVMIMVLFNQNSMAVNLKQIIFDHLIISVKLLSTIKYEIIVLSPERFQ